VKRLSADDSAATSVKVGHRQANIFENPRLVSSGGFSFRAVNLRMMLLLEIAEPN
jgi:hypothetical protein